MDKKRMNVLFQQAMKYAHDNPKDKSSMASVAIYKFGELIEKEVMKESHNPMTEDFRQSKYNKGTEL